MQVLLRYPSTFQKSVKLILQTLVVINLDRKCKEKSSFHHLKVYQLCPSIYILIS